MPIMEALAAIGQAIDVAKGMRAVEKSFDAAEYKMRIAELMSTLSDARLEMLEARDTLIEKDAELARMKAVMEVQADLVQLQTGFKYRGGEDGNPIGLPIRPRCEGRDGRITFFVSAGRPRQVRCPVCSDEYSGVSNFGLPQAPEVVAE